MGKHHQPNIEVFTDVYAATHKPIDAMVAAQPNLAADRNYANVKARRLLKKSDINTKIQQKMEKMASKATKKIDELIQSENEQIATTNAWKVIEQVQGKAVTKSINLNATATIEDVLFD